MLVGVVTEAVLLVLCPPVPLPVWDDVDRLGGNVVEGVVKGVVVVIVPPETCVSEDAAAAPVSVATPFVEVVDPTR